MDGYGWSNVCSRNGWLQNIAKMVNKSTKLPKPCGCYWYTAEKKKTHTHKQTTIEVEVIRIRQTKHDLIKRMWIDLVNQKSRPPKKNSAAHREWRERERARNNNNNCFRYNDQPRDCMSFDGIDLSNDKTLRIKVEIYGTEWTTMCPFIIPFINRHEKCTFWVIRKWWDQHRSELAEDGGRTES